jgi:hypothetical protein
MNEERRLLERVMYRIPSLVISEHDLDLVDEIKELLTQPEQEPIAYVANASIGFDVSRSPQGMPLVWLGKLEYGDELYRVGKR